jgi:RNA polymerase sigma-70 factor (ECF subfamily)
VIVTGVDAISEVPLNLPDDAQPPDEAAHWLLLHLEVQEAIDRLPELHRQALILYAEENLSYSEIAEVMNTSVGTVKSRMHYAKRILRGLLRSETLSALEAEFGSPASTATSPDDL